jgi:uncharacterized hydrophobic protein (TIGR00271 family)
MGTVTVPDQQNKRAVREHIREGASFSWAYLLMNMLAATIACYGLFANSPAVVIGAMIVAMLLGPITGIGLALVDSDMALLRQGLTTLLGGVAGVMITASILGTIHRDIPITNEIMARTSPNLIDLMVALAGGAAGAYATVSPRLSIAFVGVAIATALVPPLSSACILLARGETTLALGAFLLAFTNMVAIQFASSTVLWLTGFRRVTRTAGLGIVEFLKDNSISIVVLVALGVMLGTNLQRVIARQLFESTTRSILAQEIGTSAGSYLAEVRFETVSGATLVRAVVRGPNPPSAAQVGALEDKLPPPPDGTALELRVRFVQTLSMNRDGTLFADVAFGSSE